MQNILGDLQEGLLFILSAPAGTGKTTLVSKLQKEFPNVVESVSYTTRKPRAEEREGVDYHFISREAFQKKIALGDFLEHVELYGEHYGTSKQWVEEKKKEGKHVFLVIDTQGALKLKGHVTATWIFVRPPSLQELARRLEMRQTESQEKVSERLEWSKHELSVSGEYDYQVVNDDLNVAYDSLRSILIAEVHKTKNFRSNNGKTV